MRTYQQRHSLREADARLSTSSSSVTPSLFTFISTGILLTASISSNVCVVTAQPPHQQLQFDCSYEEDLNAEFLNTKGNYRQCKWLLTDPDHVVEECSSAESVSRLGVIALTDADMVCPWSCGKCSEGYTPSDEKPLREDDEEEQDTSSTMNILDAFEDNDGNGIDDDEGDEGNDSDMAAALGLKDNVAAVKEKQEDDDDEEDYEVAFDDSTELYPHEKEQFQEIKVNILDPSGIGGDSSIGSGPVIGILPRRSRTWQEIYFAPTTLNPSDPMQALQASTAVENDPFFFTGIPTMTPTSSPSAAPSDMPSVTPSGRPSSQPSAHPSVSPSASPTAEPSANPSASPTAEPSASPSASPTGRPTLSPTPYPSGTPTLAPTPAPTQDPWKTLPVPSNPPSAYFNYDPGRSAKRGVQNWDSVSSPPEAKYWKEFDEYIADSLSNNKCDSGSRRQSPIDVSFDDARGQCFEYHQIRAKAGEYSIEEPIVEKQILPSKLRFVYPRNYNKEASWATENDSIKGPSADIPKGWGHQLPVTHVDIKVPSEHWMEGKQYVAEYQIFLIQNREQKQRGAPAISVLFDLHPEDERNARFDILLDAFEDEYNADKAKCENRMRRQRRLGALFGKSNQEDAVEDQSTWLDEPEEEEEKFQRHLRKVKRKAQEYRKFNPWSSDIVRTLYFYGYEGSLTEPPCTEFVEWRVLDTPALISRKQLWRLKKIMFHHVDGDCKQTSVHFEGSVARPIQPYSGRLVHRCMCRDYLGDRDRARLGMNRCLWKERDQFGFPRDQFSLDWYQRTHKYEDPKDQPLTDWASF